MTVYTELIKQEADLLQSVSEDLIRLHQLVINSQKSLPTSENLRFVAYLLEVTVLAAEGREHEKLQS